MKKVSRVALRWLYHGRPTGDGKAKHQFVLTPPRATKYKSNHIFNSALVLTSEGGYVCNIFAGVLSVRMNYLGS
jgi:hypothetical protein